MSFKTYEVKVYDNGNKHWRLNGKLHREDGPACECLNGDKYWYLNGELHREDGPAVECLNGDKYWYLNGELHREDGPACEYVNGDKYCYLNGKELTEKEWKQQTNKEPSCDGKIVEVEGKKYRLTKI